MSSACSNLSLLPVTAPWPLLLGLACAAPPPTYLSSYCRDQYLVSSSFDLCLSLPSYPLCSRHYCAGSCFSSSMYSSCLKLRRRVRYAPLNSSPTAWLWLLLWLLLFSPEGSVEHSCLRHKSAQRSGISATCERVDEEGMEQDTKLWSIDSVEKQKHQQEST